MSDTTQVQTGTAAPAAPGRLSVEEAAESLLNERSAPQTPARAKAQVPQPARSSERADEENEAEPQRPDTPESTEPETPAEDTGAAEPAEPEAPQEEDTDDPEYELKVGDKSETVRLSELQKGYLRQQDYSRKTEEVANFRKTYQTELADIRNERAAYTTMLKALKAQIEEGPAPVNWEQLRQTDPIGYLEQKEAQRERQVKLAAIKEEEARLTQVQERERQTLMQQARADATQVLLQKIPSWQQPETRQREVTALVQTVVDAYGYQPAELDQIIDPRFILLARDAMLYRQSRGQTNGVAQKRVAPSPGRPVPAKRSVPQSDPHAAKKQAAQVQFQRRPSINTAIDALLAERGEE